MAEVKEYVNLGERFDMQYYFWSLVLYITLIISGPVVFYQI